jgi:hypothetical protein
VTREAPGPCPGGDARINYALVVFAVTIGVAQFYAQVGELSTALLTTRVLVSTPPPRPAPLPRLAELIATARSDKKTLMPNGTGSVRPLKFVVLVGKLRIYGRNWWFRVSSSGAVETTALAMRTLRAF